jgi:hypothetical protein
MFATVPWRSFGRVNIPLSAESLLDLDLPLTDAFSDVEKGSISLS